MTDSSMRKINHFFRWLFSVYLSLDPSITLTSQRKPEKKKKNRWKQMRMKKERGKKWKKRRFRFRPINKNDFELKFRWVFLVRQEIIEWSHEVFGAQTGQMLLNFLIKSIKNEAEQKTAHIFFLCCDTQTAHGIEKRKLPTIFVRSTLELYASQIRFKRIDCIRLAVFVLLSVQYLISKSKQLKSHRFRKLTRNFLYVWTIVGSASSFRISNAFRSVFSR